jgi:hypothetical protein
MLFRAGATEVKDKLLLLWVWRADSLELSWRCLPYSFHIHIHTQLTSFGPDPNAQVSTFVEKE